jgi:hypothetical protein
VSFQFFVLPGEPDQKRLAKLQPGQVVTIEGHCKGWLAKLYQQDERECIYFWDSAVVRAR